ncbi:YkgJ family cysteine cluster protein [Candidatus Woesearchaeota archaeon]|nr:YkgJ family cysteine cluster protein [Candidatus Woesearchaeota archaeon]
MAKFPCQNGEPCNRCGGCCKIRENFRMDVVDELTIKQKVYARTRVIYLYPMNRYTISLSHEEKARLERIAKERSVSISILPKKVIYDAVNDKAVVWDWFVDHDICPFLKGDNECTIYEDRPEICRMFPEIKNEQMFEIQEFVKNIPVVDLQYDVLVERARKSLECQGVLPIFCK